MSPPAARPIQEACGGKPRGNGGNPKWARIVNPMLNQSPMLRRKDAERLVSLGRAMWVSHDQLRLDPTHPVNEHNATVAARGYEWPTGKILPTAQEFRNIPVLMPGKLLREGSNDSRNLAPILKRDNRVPYDPDRPAAKRIEFSSCPPFQLTEDKIHGLGYGNRVVREPDGAPSCARPAPEEIYPRVL